MSRCIFENVIRTRGQALKYFSRVMCDECENEECEMPVMPQLIIMMYVHYNTEEKLYASIILYVCPKDFVQDSFLKMCGGGLLLYLCMTTCFFAKKTAPFNFLHYDY